MPLGLSPRESTTALDWLQQQPTAVIPPVSTGEVVAENLMAVPKGIASGVSSVYQTAASGMTAAFSNFVAEPLRDAAMRAGNMGMPVPPSGVVTLDPEILEREQAIANAETARRLAPDPRTSGAGAQLLHTVVSGATRMVGGALLAGPAGGAAVMGLTEGSATRDNLMAAGVDRDTADGLALGSALFAGGGALLPGGLGSKLITRVLSGSGIQVTAGMANRAMLHIGLEDAGYTDMAKQYAPLDGAAMMADAVLGGVFGAVHHAFAPDVVDSAHMIKDGQHAEEAAGGPATSPESREAILYNDTRAAEALIAGHDIAETRDVTILPDAAQEAARATRATQVEEAAAEVGARPVEAPAAPDLMLPEGTGEGVPQMPSRPAETAAKAEADPLAEIDDATREVIDQAKAALARREGMTIGGETGDVKAADALQRAVADIQDSGGEDVFVRVAAACFGRA